MCSAEPLKVAQHRIFSYVRQAGSLLTLVPCPPPCHLQACTMDGHVDVPVCAHPGAGAACVGCRGGSAALPRQPPGAWLPRQPRGGALGRSAEVSRSLCRLSSVCIHTYHMLHRVRSVQYGMMPKFHYTVPDGQLTPKTPSLFGNRATS